jgi:signal transduction histidine kinase
LSLSSNLTEPPPAAILDGWAADGSVRIVAPKAQRVALIALAPMVAVTLWLGLTSDHLQRPLDAALYWSYLIAASMGIGLYWWRRRPASRFGPLLVVFGVLTWIVSWQGANAPLAFALGVVAEGPFFVLTFYLFLAFPMGRLEPAAARWLMAALVLGVLAFFVPWTLFAPVIAGGGPLTSCAPDCPENPLQIATAPNVVDVAGKLETYVALTLTVAVLLVYAWRLYRSSRPQRRALTAVAVTSLLFLPAYFVVNFAAWVLYLDAATVSTLAWGIVATRVLLPLGFLVALLQADRFAAAALRAMLERLATRPSPEDWRDTIAEALDDPELQLGYRDPAGRGFRQHDGRDLTPPSPAQRRAWVPIDRADQPVAAMVLDETLTEDPELVRAAATATRVAVENGALEGELRETRARVLRAGEAERKRIESELHDSAQQRLIALRIQLTLAGEQHRLDRDMLQRLDSEVELAIEDLRGVAHGSLAASVRQRGLRAALADAAARAPVPVRLEFHGLTRQADMLEAAIYFCCLECLQNVAKHAGSGATATVILSQHDDRVSFSVADDGAGFDRGAVRYGAGLMNLTERVTALGGELRIDARPGHGTRVTGTLPLA